MSPRGRAAEALQDAHGAVLDWANSADGEQAAVAREVLADTSAALRKALAR